MMYVGCMVLYNVYIVYSRGIWNLLHIIVIRSRFIPGRTDLWDRADDCKKERLFSVFILFSKKLIIFQEFQFKI